MNTKRFFLYYGGNLLIGFSLVLAAFIYYPYIYQIFFPPHINVKTINKQFSIYIPKINAYSKIIANVSPWDSKEYEVALSEGVAHAKGSVVPGEQGTIFLFAHSSLPPWKMTRTNTAFLSLENLRSDDLISLYFKGKEYKYRVFDKKIVWPNEIQYLKDFSANQLILQTCYPIGTSFQRLLVFAKSQ